MRGKLLDVLRAAHEPVDTAALEPAWDDAVQRSRCLDSLLTDGLLVEQTDDGLFTLPGIDHRRREQREGLQSQEGHRHPASAAISATTRSTFRGHVGRPPCQTAVAPSIAPTIRRPP